MVPGGSDPLLFTGMGSVLGAIIGSFLGGHEERVPTMVMDENTRGNLLFPASHCPVCQHSLRAWENIPIVSWLVLRGRCSHCQSAIHCGYFSRSMIALFGAPAGGYPIFRRCFLWLLAAFLLFYSHD